MKKTLLLISISIFFLKCEKDKEFCTKNIPEWCTFVDLSTEYVPVCGCDGITYQNAGHAQCIGGVSIYEERSCQ